MLDIASLEDFCARHQLPHARSDSGALLVGRPGDLPAIQCVPRTDRGMMTFLTVLPERAPPDKHPEVARALALANSGSYMGAWVLNGIRGQIYLRVTVPTRGVQWEDGGIRLVLEVVISTFDALGPRIVEVIEGRREATALMR